jgi:hypothetical protein
MCAVLHKGISIDNSIVKSGKYIVQRSESLRRFTFGCFVVSANQFAAMLSFMVPELIDAGRAEQRHEQELERQQMRHKQTKQNGPSHPPPYSTSYGSDMVQRFSDAVEAKDTLEVKKLLDLRPLSFDIDATNVEGQVPLSLAVQKEDEDMIKLLLANGAVPTRRDWQGKKAINYANDNDKILKLLLQPPAVDIQPEAKIPPNEVEKPYSAAWPCVNDSEQPICQEFSAFVLKSHNSKKQRNSQMTV